MLNNSESQTVNEVVTSSSNSNLTVAQKLQLIKQRLQNAQNDKVAELEAKKAVEVPKVAEASEHSKFNLKALRKLAKNFSGDTALVPCEINSEGAVNICDGAEEWRKCEISKHDLEDFPNINALGMVLDKYLMLKCSDNAGIQLPETLCIDGNSLIFRIPEDLEQPIKSFSNEEFEVTTGSDQYQLVAGAGIKTNENYQIAELSPALLQLVTNPEVPSPTFSSSSDLKARLIEGLKIIPEDWALTPVGNNKNAYITGWANGTGASRDELITDIKSGKAKGYGLMSGEVSGDIIALDIDGHSGMVLLNKLLRHNPLPKTVECTSGRDGRNKLFLKVPKEYSTDDFKTRRISTGVPCSDEPGKFEGLELHWNGAQDVLPPSLHPMTGSYYWVNSPETTEIADTPVELLQILSDGFPKLENVNSYKNKFEALEIPVDASIPLECCLARNTREALKDVVLIGAGRNSTGFAIAQDLIGTAEYLQSIGQKFEGNPETVFFDWTSSNGLDTDKPAGQPEKIWNSANNSNPDPSLDKEFIDNNIKHWYLKTQKTSSRNSSTANSQNSSNPPNGKNNQESDSNDNYERLKLEIKAYIQETDLFKKKLIKSKICTNYHQSKQDFEELVTEAENLEIIPEKVTFTFEEFINASSDSLDWLIPGVLPKGETVLLSALAKCGKTNLAFDAIKALLAGGHFLGEQLSAGKALIVSSDESVNSTRRRLLNTGISDLSTQNNLLIRTYLDITKLSAFDAELESFRPDLVVIDSLTSICSDVGVSENEAKFATYIYKLKEKLAKYGASAILIHHENKDALAKGINKISGSARISAAVWGIWQLSAINPDDHNDKQRTLAVTPREAEKASFKLEMNPRDLWLEESIFNFLGELGDESGEKKSNGEKVIQLLETSIHPLSFFDIDGVLFIGRSLYATLDRLVDRQIIAKTKKPGTRTWLYSKDS